MASPSPDPTTAGMPPLEPAGQVWAEVSIVFLTGLVVLALSRLLITLGPIASEIAGTLTVLYFFAVPIAVLRWRQRDPAAFAIHTERLGHGVLVALAAGAIVFPPYVAGYEAWSRAIFQAPMHLPKHLLTDFTSDLLGRPDPVVRSGLSVWVEGEWFYATNGSGILVEPTLAGCGCPTDALEAEGSDLHLRGRLPACVEGGPLQVPLSNRRGFRCSTASADVLTLAVPNDNVPVLTGAAAQTRAPGTTRFDRTPWWLPQLLLIQIVGVALPEEVFYRGYLQGRLAPLFRRRIRIFGVPLGAHIVVASALFALSHLILIPAPFRLAVFFPGLLFGYLRERTGSVVAPVLLHGASNVLLEVLVRFHG